MIITSFIQLEPFRHKQGIYLFTNKENPDKRYAGQSKKLYSRIVYEHGKAKNYKNQYIDRVIKKYGLLNKFHIELIHWWDNPVSTLELLALETAVIDAYDCLITKGGYNYCLFDHDRKGLSMSFAARKKMSKNRMGSKNPCYGRKHTREEIANLRIKCKIQDISKKIKPIKQINKNTLEIIKIWPSMKEAANLLQIQVPGISAVCRKYKDKEGYLTKTYKGFYWKYA